MKKILGVLLLLFLLVGISACGSSSSSDGGAKLDKIKEAGKIVIGTNSGYPPYEFYDTRDGKKELVGYDIDLGNKIAAELGVKAEFVDMEFDALIPSLTSGKIDIVLAGMVDTDERRKAVDFSDPYYDTMTVLVAKKDKIDAMASVAGLKGKTAVVQVATTQEEIAKSIDGLTITSLPTVGDTIASLTSGKADGLLIAEVSAKNIVAQFPDYTYKEIDGKTKEEMFDGASVAMNKKESNLQTEINKVIKSLKDSGELDKMFNKNVELYNEINK